MCTHQFFPMTFSRYRLLPFLFHSLEVHFMNSYNHDKMFVKSVQSALSDLLTTSATHGTFSRPSTKRGLILIDLELNTNARESFENC